MSAKKIAVFVGSLRKDSLNRKMAEQLIVSAPPEMKFEILEIGNLPLYNQDLDFLPPTAWTDFRSKLKRFDGVLFVTPEYNRSIPGVLKNAIDIGSRPYGENAFDGKPGAVVSVSPGAAGGFGANHHLRQTLVFLNVPTMQQPEAYFGNADKIFVEGEKFINDKTLSFIKSFMISFNQWIERNQILSV